MKDIDMEVGKRIRELRKSRKWTQDELGEMLGLTGTQISKSENGRAGFSLGRLLRLAEIFATQPEQLCPEIVRQAPPQIASPPNIRPPGMDENRQVYYLDAEERYMVDKYRELGTYGKKWFSKIFIDPDKNSCDT